MAIDTSATRPPPREETDGLLRVSNDASRLTATAWIAPCQTPAAPPRDARARHSPGPLRVVRTRDRAAVLGLARVAPGALVVAAAAISVDRQQLALGLVLGILLFAVVGTARQLEFDHVPVEDGLSVATGRSARSLASLALVTSDERLHGRRLLVTVGRPVRASAVPAPSAGDGG